MCLVQFCALRVLLKTMTLVLGTLPPTLRGPPSLSPPATQGLIEHTMRATLPASQVRTLPTALLSKGRTTWLSICLTPCFGLVCCEEKYHLTVNSKMWKKSRRLMNSRGGVWNLRCFKDPFLWELEEILWPIPQPSEVGFGGEEESPVRTPNVLSYRKCWGLGCY